MPCNIDDLPEELLVHIFEKLSTRYRDVHSASLVCRLWFKLAWSSVHTLYLRKFPNVLEGNHLLFSLVHCVQTSVLHLPPDTTDRHLQMLETAPLLQEIYIRRCRNITDAGLMCLSSMELKEIYLSTSWNISSLAFLRNSVKSLTHLELRGCDLIGDQSLIDLEQACSHPFYQMKYLDLRDCNSITTLGLSILTMLMPTLRMLDASGCPLTDESLEAISTLRHLEDLWMWGCVDISNDGLRHLGRIPHLKRLSILDCEEIDDRGLKILKDSATLQAIELGGRGRITLQGFRWLLYIPTLTNISIVSNTPALIEEELVALKEQHKPTLNLQYVQLFA